ncbi:MULTISPECIES: DUF6377 domain-containing protein [unclassified Mucilaginibacter]|uniref:DUF6377 domain-containing protein n=1 Tax=unclassified Mucilaginibacter TaxID=2617802 RepID=UPI002AC9178F|nr:MULTISPECIES: DUF6377 domain-containing protein [unclassified Mucilaginibacter]MEB0277433.1 DUF6377 domain-containing protein [Mucilaginibacter sp. 10B2]MEB0300942.1 DUF6377 domain-containing protein [Mucilaginibacter sp. 5C4]WPX24937.1 DUF6377 domain-containing protein [Mucilaginibacter sp. 5C4]
MKIAFFLLFLLFITTSFQAERDIYPNVTELNNAIISKNDYTKQKEENITAIKRVRKAGLPLLVEYRLNTTIYEEYRKFKIDSAIFYAYRNLQIAYALNDKELKDVAKIELSNLYSSSGKYRESETLLRSLNSRHLSRDGCAIYYEAYSRFFEHYITNSYSQVYIQQVETYRDSLLSVLDTSSMKFKLNMAEKNIFQRKIAIAQSDLLKIFNVLKREHPDYGTVSYLLGNTYELQHNSIKKKKYYIISAIADLKNSIKDNAAMQTLAIIYFKEGDIDNAYRCTRSAIEDAIFCKVKFRTLQMSELYTIINTSYQIKEAKAKKQLQLYLIMISILSLFLILTVLYVYKQIKKVSKIKEELHLTSEKLVRSNKDIVKANDSLNERNALLLESNHIKEKYIAHFFDLCSTYVNKLENYRKTLNKKATDKQLDELFKMLRSTTVADNELEQLYIIFDRIFLNLYPTFIQEFNALLIREERVIVKQGELLNTELRIFALIRLGITDSVKIAGFLRYSLSTIYNYRTSARNRAAVARDDFEEMVLKIGFISPQE